MTEVSVNVTTIQLAMTKLEAAKTDGEAVVALVRGVGHMPASTHVSDSSTTIAAGNAYVLSAHGSITRYVDRLNLLLTSLGLAATAFAELEARIAASFERLLQGGAWMFGRLVAHTVLRLAIVLPGIIVTSGLILATLVTPVLFVIGISTFIRTGRVPLAAEEFLEPFRDLGHLPSNVVGDAAVDAIGRLTETPIMQTLIRLAVSYVDEFSEGAVAATGLPFLPRVGWGPKPNAIVDALFRGGAASGLIPDRSFVVKRVPIGAGGVRGTLPGPVNPPSGYGDLIAKIPPSDEHGPQVQITKYENPDGEIFWEVLVTGTSSQGLGNTTNPLDNLGNAAAYSGNEAESVAAVLEAMAAAGIAPGDTVVLGGYSQGGIVAARVAESGLYNTTLLVTAGAPIGGVPIPDGIPVVEFQHNEDPIVGLEGIRPPGETDSTVFSRDLYADPNREHSGEFLDPHAQTDYVDTGRLVDESTAPSFQEAQEEFKSIYSGATVLGQELFRLDRESVS